ncbi:endonuclease/exonuclease/phosphatase family protein [Streptomyces sp. NPDC048551]|uniref:endonuclease/exonuclease/phosphatase family protein n=1 Tax=Streptomyces sp. NPDC048551 TaxID=3155758 RepID=UPI00341AB541
MTPRPRPRPLARLRPVRPLRPLAGRCPRGAVTAALALVAASVMLLHRWIPGGAWAGHARSLVQTFLPWTGLAVPVLLAVALLRRSRLASAAVVLPALVWGLLYGPALAGGGGPGGPAELTVITHNVDDANPDPAGTARAVAASGAQLIALEELTQPATGAYKRTLGASHPYHAVRGTVGLWSTFPLREVHAEPVVPWRLVLRATADTPHGPVTVYVAHLPSVRLGAAGFTTGRRDTAAHALAAVLRAGPGGPALLLGDFNGTTDDTALAGVTDRFTSARTAPGAGFGFSWPAAFPVARIDQILVRDLTPVSARTLPRTGSDHLPIAASLRF